MANVARLGITTHIYAVDCSLFYLHWISFPCISSSNRSKSFSLSHVSRFLAKGEWKNFWTLSCSPKQMSIVWFITKVTKSGFYAYNFQLALCYSSEHLCVYMVACMFDHVCTVHLFDCSLIHKDQLWMCVCPLKVTNTYVYDVRLFTFSLSLSFPFLEFRCRRRKESEKA